MAASDNAADQINNDVSREISASPAPTFRQEASAFEETSTSSWIPQYRNATLAVKLNNNWRDWSSSLRAALGRRGIAIVIENDYEYLRLPNQAWENYNDAGIQLIHGSLSDEIRPGWQLTSSDTAHGLYRTLEAQYAPNDTETLKDATSTFFCISAIPLTLDAFNTWAVKTGTSMSTLRGTNATLDAVMAAFIMSNIPAEIAHVQQEFKIDPVTNSLPSPESVISRIRSAIRQRSPVSAAAPAVLTAAPAAKPPTKFPARSESSSSTRQYKKLDPAVHKCKRCNKTGHWMRDCPATAPVPHATVNLITTDTNFVGFTGSITQANEFIFDSGATVHVARDRSAFSKLHPASLPQIRGVGGSIPCKGQGTVTFKRNDNTLFSVTNVLYCPSAPANLLSGVRYQDAGYSIHYEPGQPGRVSKDGVSLFTLSRSPGAISRVDATPIGASRPDFALVTAPLMRWHRRFAHLNFDALQKLAKSGAIPSLDVAPSSARSFCNDCAAAKAHRSTYPASNSRAQAALDLVHSDLLDFTTPSKSGYRYLITFVDDFSRMLWVSPLRSKADVHESIATFKKRVETEQRRPIKVFRSDNGTEYVNARVAALFASTGTQHQKSAVYTPQQNGRAERINRGIVEAVLAQLHQSGLSTEFWAEAAAAFTFVKNLSPHSSIDNALPWSLWTTRTANVAMLREFGCRAWYTRPAALRTKLEDKGVPAIFLGYDTLCKAWRLWDEASNKLVITRDAIFDEDTFPMASEQYAERRGGAISSPTAGECSDDVLTRAAGGLDCADSLVRPQPVPTEILPDHRADDGGTGVTGSPDPVDLLGPEIVTPSTTASTLDTPSSTSTESEPSSPTPTRPFETLASPSLPTQEAREESPDPLALALAAGIDDTFDDDLEFALPTSDPRSWAEAAQSPVSAQWIDAANEEFTELQDKYKVFTPVDRDSLPSGARVLGSKYVFRTKRDQHGDITQYKARLCAQGFNQREGTDYNETFAPTVRFNSIRSLVAIAASRAYTIQQADIDKAYLHGDLEEELYIRPPQGAVGMEGKVLKLHKSIYGLKQAGRTWNQHIDATLKSLGYKRSESDHCVYVKQVADEYYYIALYVDDLLFVGPDVTVINSTLDGLEKSYGVKRIGEAKYILGIQIIRNKDGSIALSQRRYMEDMLERFNMADCTPAEVPMSPSTSLLTQPITTTKPSTDARRYRQLLGSLTYAMTGTRPDIAFVISFLGRFSNCATMEHWRACVDVLRYLKGTLDEGLKFGPQGTPLVLSGRTDATWISCPDTSRSVNGYHLNFGGAAIAWSSKRQRRCAVSSCDAEYLGIGDASRSIVGLRDFFTELRVPQVGPTLLQGDNQGANALARNPEHHHRSRHVRLAEHIVREHVADKLIHIEYLPTNEMSADALTKPLAHCKFVGFKKDMGVCKVTDV